MPSAHCIKNVIWIVTSENQIYVHEMEAGAMPLLNIRWSPQLNNTFSCEL